MEVEQDDRCQERQDDGQAGGETLEDIIRVLDDDSSHKAAEDLDSDSGPRPTSKIAEEVENEPARAGRCGRIQDREESGDEGEEGELDVPDPEVGLGSLKHHLKVDTGESRGEAGRGDCAKTLQGIHDMYVIFVRAANRIRVLRDGLSNARTGRSLNLNNANANSQEEKRQPLCARQLFPEEGDGECGSG